jgi:hypothetical protein
MQDLIEEAGFSLPIENSPNKNGTTFRLRLKVAKRIYPWELPTPAVTWLPPSL